MSTKASPCHPGISRPQGSEDCPDYASDGLPEVAFQQSRLSPPSVPRCVRLHRRTSPQHLYSSKAASRTPLQKHTYAELTFKLIRSRWMAASVHPPKPTPPRTTSGRSGRRCRDGSSEPIVPPEIADKLPRGGAKSGARTSPQTPWRSQQRVAGLRRGQRP
eukprot:scaffold2022_cov261-Pinguiococcus_pyrenoidosus.AAC.18